MNQRPNILLIMTDQQRGDCLSCDGHEVLMTPNMDEIANGGARFRHAYSTCPVCIPARRSLMSGQFPATHGLLNYRDGLEWEAPATLPGTLSDAGYHTAIVGRSMHLFPVRKRYGFDEMTVYDQTDIDNDYVRFLRRNSTLQNPGWTSGGVMNNDWTAKPFHLEESLHFTNWVVDEALDFLKRRDPSCPFFLTTSFLAPHPPLQPPAFYFERYLRTGVPEAAIGDWASPPETWDVASLRINLQGEAFTSMRAAYYGLINHIDDQIRRLINAVNGVRAMFGDNTIVLFTSDHGEMLGDHYMFRKQQPYEPSARIPFLINAPRRFGFKSQTIIDEAVCLEDIMPTLLDLAEVPIPETVDGRSLVPLLRGEKSLGRTYLRIEYAPDFQALTDGRQKYIRFLSSGAEQFFDLENDPNELCNLAEQDSWQNTVSVWRERLVEDNRRIQNGTLPTADSEKTN